MSILLRRVSHTYMKKTPMEHTALDNISLEINEGEFTAIIGHTGSGKSTLIQHMKGLLKPDTGMVVVDGIDINNRTKAAKDMKAAVGMVFQYPEQQLFEETIYADIAFGPRNMGLDEAEITKRVQRAMKFVNLDFEEYKERSPFQLSGGQMRRVAIAGVFAMQPKYLILDEPAAGLDPVGKRNIFAKLRELNEKRGVAIIFISHDMDDVASLAKRLIVMNDSRIVYDDVPQSVFSHGAELLKMGLDIPNTAKMLRAVAAKGLAVNTAQLDVKAATAEILRCVRGRNNA